MNIISDSNLRPGSTMSKILSFSALQFRPVQILIYLKRCKSEYLFCLKEQFDLTGVMHPFGHK